MYELMSEQANREIHDPILGASLYEAPQKYIADSPDLHFAGVSTATLFEAGAYTAAIHMLGFPKAARRAGMPTEFVVYPKTQHNLATPRLQQESATRNLDWLERWLLGRGERGAAGAAAQEQLQPRGGD
jgi:dipeptidyl aminopeptidase/acylaminoacyl peptidase